GEDGNYRAKPPQRLGLPDEVVVAVIGTANPVRWPRLSAHLQSVAAVGSPYLPRLLEAGDGTNSEGAVWVSRESWGPSSLANTAASLNVADRLRALSGAARAAHDLHEAGLTHGRISPRTVLVGPYKAGLEPPLNEPDAEPGLVVRARRADELDAVDPALLRGDPPSRSTDVWALGATIHRTFTGHLLHPGLGGDVPSTAVARALFEAPQLDPALPAELRPLVEACLSPDPADRPASALEVAEQLQAGGRA
ncbi:MAG: hypothetical protein ACRDYC_03345, partial [Acidimicrobiales bacterium]